MTSHASTWVLALASILVAAPASAAVTLQGTRIIHDARQGRDVTVRASNVGELPAMTQVWIDDG
ncbi:MAG TPA: molecular chaperone, partial [Stenotrophomonas sp.]|nr:molecular chaperone [Stenotrophomonas sp.]